MLRVAIFMPSEWVLILRVFVRLKNALALRRWLQLFSDAFERVIVCGYAQTKRGRLSKRMCVWACEDWGSVEKLYVRCDERPGGRPVVRSCMKATP